MLPPENSEIQLLQNYCELLTAPGVQISTGVVNFMKKRAKRIRKKFCFTETIKIPNEIK